MEAHEPDERPTSAPAGDASLDRDREASLADEGGASAARYESQQPARAGTRGPDRRDEDVPAARRTRRRRARRS